MLGYKILDKTSLFDLPYKAWQNKPKATRTWKNFKILFIKAETDRSKQTTKELDYANAMAAKKSKK